MINDLIKRISMKCPDGNTVRWYYLLLFITIILLFVFKTDDIICHKKLLPWGWALVIVWTIAPPTFFFLEFIKKQTEKENIETNLELAKAINLPTLDIEERLTTIDKEISLLRHWQTLAKDWWIALSAILVLVKDFYQ